MNSDKEAFQAIQDLKHPQLDWFLNDEKFSSELGHSWKQEISSKIDSTPGEAFDTTKRGNTSSRRPQGDSKKLGKPADRTKSANVHSRKKGVDSKSNSKKNSKKKSHSQDDVVDKEKK